MTLPLNLLAIILLERFTLLHAAEPIEPRFIVGQDGPTSDCFFTKHPEETKLADFNERPAYQVTGSQKKRSDNNEARQP